MSANARPCVAVSWEDVQQHAHALAHQVKESGFQPDIIVGIARGGLTAAGLVCDHLSVHDFLSVKIDHWTTPGQPNPEGPRVRHPLGSRLDGKKVLIVDDVADSGRTLQVAHAREQGATDVRTACLYVIGGAAHKPEYYAQAVDGSWVVFPWTRAEDVRQFTWEQLEQSPRPVPVKELQHLVVKARELFVPARELESALHELEARGLARSLPPRKWGGEVTWQRR